jgi:hypothetical protein
MDAAIATETAAMFERHAYEVVHVSAGRTTGCHRRHPLRDVTVAGEFDDLALDREPRLITALVDTPVPMRIVSVHVPHGRSLDHWHFYDTLEFLDALTPASPAGSKTDSSSSAAT